MDKQETLQNKKRSRKERLQERNRLETEEQKFERLRKIREQQRQKLVNEIAQEKEIWLAKRRETHKNPSEETKRKRREYLRDRRQRQCREDRESRLQVLRQNAATRIESQTPEQQAECCKTKYNRESGIRNG